MVDGNMATRANGAQRVKGGEIKLRPALPLHSTPLLPHCLSFTANKLDGI